MSNNQIPSDLASDDPKMDAQLNAELDQLFAQASKAERAPSNSAADQHLKRRILEALPASTATTTATTTTSKATPQAAANGSWLDEIWHWFAQPLRLAAAAMLPLIFGFALGNAGLMTDNELLVALSEQDSWPLEQMLDETQWSEPND